MSESRSVHGWRFYIDGMIGFAEKALSRLKRFHHDANLDLGNWLDWFLGILA
nr:hypothetical protein [Halomonas socia]